jgi:hypothetical protein
MSELPGRKAIVLLSDGFRLFNRTVSAGGGNFRPNSPKIATVNESMAQALKNLIETANRAGVVINTIDARGVQAPGAIGADEDTNGVNVRETTLSREHEVMDTQQGLRYLADETGGRAFYGNSLSGGIQKSLNDQNGYYLIGYQPDSETFDFQKRKFNKLTVRLKRPDLKVRYRSGFSGVTDDQARPPAQALNQRLRNALNSPFGAGDIDMRLTSIYANDPREGNFVRAFLHVEARDLTFVDAGDGTGSKTATFNVVAYTAGEAGNIVDDVLRTYSLNIKEEEYQRLLKTGLTYLMNVPIKKSGAYQLRVAFHDKQSDKIGSANQFIEVPNLEKKHLALSGIMLQSYTAPQWQAKLQGKLQTVSTRENSTIVEAQRATASRRFARGTILNFAYAVYNAKINSAGRKTDLQVQVRLIRDGQVVVAGEPAQLDTTRQADLSRIEAEGAVTIGRTLPPGDYILQIIVTDNLAKGKNQMTTQWMDFEVTE